MVNQSAKLFTLPPAYNEFGYNESLLVTHNFLCIFLLFVSWTLCSPKQIKYMMDIKEACHHKFRS